MLTTRAPEQPKEIVYPESDGMPMADNTLQFRWIVTIQGGLDLLFKDDPNVFVSGDLLWYPVEGENTIRVTSDVMVVFGRPKGDRGAYLQWREDGIAPQVVFDVLSPGNTVMEMTRKLGFYDRYGIEEYYLYDPIQNELSVWVREKGGLREVETVDGWVSPRL
jgi:Uma2 family endonuclease